MFKFFNKNKKETVETIVPVVEPKKPITIDDIKDEDMMVAALVATIDYANETKQDVRLISIRQIG